MSEADGPSTRYYNAAGQQVSREEYYQILAPIAREQQARFPWWHLRLCLWKRAEREYRREAQSPDPSDGTP